MEKYQFGNNCLMIDSIVGTRFEVREAKEQRFLKSYTGSLIIIQGLVCHLGITQSSPHTHPLLWPACSPSLLFGTSTREQAGQEEDHQ